MSKRSLWLTLTVLFPLETLAFAPPPPPDSGSLLQQNKPAPSVTPSSNNTGLVVDNQSKSNLPDSAPFLVTRIEIDGNTLFSTQLLHDLFANVEGHEQTLSQLEAVVARITDFYHSHGYPLARAYIPAQIMRDGIVRVSVLEARYGQVILTNHSRVQDTVIENTLACLKSGSQIEITQLDRTLLLLSDIPGVNATSVIKPGNAVASSDLVIEATATSPWNGTAILDNDGNRYTGRTRLGATFNWVDPLHQGDVLSVSAMTTGSDMDNLSVTYETLVNGPGTRAGGSISALHYSLGDNLSGIGAHGVAQVASLWLKYPWQRSRAASIYSQIQFDYKKLNDDIDSTGIETNRHSNSAIVSFNGDLRNDFLAGSISTWSAAWKAGRLNFDNLAAQAVDAKSASTQGGFIKWNGTYNLLQNLNAGTAIFVALAGQWSNTNLDSAEKMVAGGAYTVRAYDMGAVSGDRGLLGNLELRHNLGNPGSYGQWQAIAFVDSEHVTVNQTTWTTGSNGANLTGAGLGLNWSNSSGWYAKVYVAAPVGTEPVLITDGKKTRGWAELGSWF